MSVQHSIRSSGIVGVYPAHHRLVVTIDLPGPTGGIGLTYADKVEGLKSFPTAWMGCMER
ncbi:MAG: hypothetical protein R3D55_24745 [Chloroflexota bacterium]